ncbi:gliding motility-associated C-terminal domain-containing protein [Adhaeribacter soli]|uniref:Gliding motility-associated C-terminal domain-containing protein n=1 Tax=Adhaeribacter soli TaxID=2607655 RepID=A0A5N1J540_9BACT|nr:gliding motility-associated C-terminal domain-containing protein [Adhaeribacter soli]KAA9340924.1 gliding motility-associated C-terminal domain-containing protein [Adhaeribacter soli]
MKKILNLYSLLLAVLLTGFSRQAAATHFQGGDLTYVIIAPNSYLVTAKVYRDCTGNAANTTNTLKIWSPGCNTGRTIAMTMQGSLVTGTPYCASVGNHCTKTGRPNYQEVTFTAQVTLSTAEQACSDWIFSTRNSARNTNENIVGQDYIYTEAFVKIKSPGSGSTALVNTSPQFSGNNIPIPIVCYGQPTRFSLNANEPDNDSLTYELIAAHSNYNTPIAYKSNPVSITPGNLITNPNPKTPFNAITPQFAQVQGVMPPVFSPTYPMPSVNVNWDGPATVAFPDPSQPNGVRMIWAATPAFNLNPLSGELVFTPSAYYSGTAPDDGRNKYVVVVQINEWRKINGVAVKVGHVRRDILFIVEDCAGNQATQPVLPAPPAVFGTNITSDSIIDVQTCNSTPLRFLFTDPNPGDKITVTFDADVLKRIPNSYLKISNNGTTSVEALLYLTPEPEHEGRNYYLPVTITDDHCPIKGTATYIYRIHVVKNNFAEPDGGLKARTVCIGEGTDLNVKLLRPDSLLLPPATKAQKAIYTYEWSLDAASNAATAGFNPATSRNQRISVKPTAVGNYRYNLKISSSLSGCFDTISFAVKVLPLPVIQDIKVLYPKSTNEIVFGRSAPINVALGNADIDPAAFNYSWSPATGLSDSTAMNPIASPLKTTRYQLTVTSKNGNCKASREVTVNVGPFFLPNIITPNNDGDNDAFVYKGILPNTSLKIYNRWGVLVKSYNNYDNSFKAEGVADGTYYYLLQEPNGGKSYKGWFDIVRK